MNSLTQKAMLNPFIQAAVIFTLTGVGMIRKPAGAWTIALVGVTVYSIVAPLFMALTRQWLRRLYLTNMAVIALWAATMLLARLMSPYPAESPPPFLFGGMVYVYSIALSAGLRIVFPIITRIFSGRPAAEPGKENENKGGNGP